MCRIVCLGFESGHDFGQGIRRRKPELQCRGDTSVATCRSLSGGIAKTLSGSPEPIEVEAERDRA
jgi:hypothetical protein